MKQYCAEFLGTFWLVLGGCGSAVLAAAFPQVGIGLLGVAAPGRTLQPCSSAVTRTSVTWSRPASCACMNELDSLWRSRSGLRFSRWRMRSAIFPAAI